jgi:hypothetical protein
MQRKLNCVLLIYDEPANFFNRMLIKEANCTKHIQIAETGQEAPDFCKSGLNIYY